MGHGLPQGGCRRWSLARCFPWEYTRGLLLRKKNESWMQPTPDTLLNASPSLVRWHRNESLQQKVFNPTNRPDDSVYCPHIANLHVSSRQHAYVYSKTGIYKYLCVFCIYVHIYVSMWLYTYCKFALCNHICTCVYMWKCVWVYTCIYREIHISADFSPKDETRGLKNARQVLSHSA